MITVSVAMTTYNGAKYIKTQIESILLQLAENDELIISDDGSTDGTISIIESYLGDPRVRLVKGPSSGVVKNFEYVISLTRNDIILLADQDDYWLPTKIDTVRIFFRDHTHYNLLLHDMYEATNTDIEQKAFAKTSFEIRKRQHGVLYNTLYNGYYGCCMAFTKELKNILLPFPKSVVLYDQWISLVSEKMKRSYFMQTPLIAHRRHADQFSKKKSMLERLRIRCCIVLSFLEVLPRLKKR